MTKICDFYYPLNDLARAGFDTLFMTIAAGTVALNISYEGLLLTVLTGNDEKVASSQKQTQFKTRVLKPYLM